MLIDSWVEGQRAYDNCGVPGAHGGVFVFCDGLESVIAGLEVLGLVG